MSGGYRFLYYLFAAIFVFNSVVLIELLKWRGMYGPGGWGLDVMLALLASSTLMMLGLSILALLAGGKVRRQEQARRD